MIWLQACETEMWKQFPNQYSTFQDFFEDVQFNRLTMDIKVISLFLYLYLSLCFSEIIIIIKMLIIMKLSHQI